MSVQIGPNLWPYLKPVIYGLFFRQCKDCTVKVVHKTVVRGNFDTVLAPGLSQLMGSIGNGFSGLDGAIGDITGVRDHLLGQPSKGAWGRQQLEAMRNGQAYSRYDLNEMLRQMQGAKWSDPPVSSPQRVRQSDRKVQPEDSGTVPEVPDVL